MPKLNARKVDSLTAPGMYGDGEGLYLRIGRHGGKSWVLRTVVYGRRRDLGIGSASLVSLSDARENARQLRKVARAGGDPDTLRKRETLTFEEATKRVHKNLLPTWRSERHGQIWLAALKRYAYPHFGARPIDTITTADILNVLEPIWSTKHDTAARVKQRIAAIFDWAKGAGHYPNENPVHGVKKALPAVKSSVQHMSALSWQELPSFMRELAQRDGTSARALEFLILTVARSGEARGARWSEIDGKVWTVPGSRMKSGTQHRVPLSSAAIKVLKRAQGLNDSLVFPSPTLAKNKVHRPLSDTVFKSLMDRMNRENLTTHGFRSTFRDWCSESAHADREVAEAALSHVLGNKVERAYARSDLFERRQTLMDAWARFATGEGGDVIQMVRA